MLLPNLAAGPWILAVGTDAYGRTIGVLCLEDSLNSIGGNTKEKGVNGSGLWIFVRDPAAKQEVVDAARKALVNLGFTLQRLMDVEQDGCKYEGALIKK